MIFVGRDRGDDFRLAVNARVRCGRASYERIEVWPRRGPSVAGSSISRFSSICLSSMTALASTLLPSSAAAAAVLTISLLSLSASFSACLSVVRHRLDSAERLDGPCTLIEMRALQRCDQCGNGDGAQLAERLAGGVADGVGVVIQRVYQRGNRARIAWPQRAQRVECGDSHLIDLVGARDVRQFRDRVSAVNMASAATWASRSEALSSSSSVSVSVAIRCINAGTAGRA